MFDTETKRISNGNEYLQTSNYSERQTELSILRKIWKLVFLFQYMCNTRFE